MVEVRKGASPDQMEPFAYTIMFVETEIPLQSSLQRSVAPNTYRQPTSQSLERDNSFPKPQHGMLYQGGFMRNKLKQSSKRMLKDKARDKCIVP
jgi:hypothetical protein